MCIVTSYFDVFDIVVLEIFCICFAYIYYYVLLSIFVSISIILYIIIITLFHYEIYFRYCWIIIISRFSDS